VLLALGVLVFALDDLAARRIIAPSALRAAVPFALPGLLLMLAPLGEGMLAWPPLNEKLRALGWLFRAYDRSTDYVLLALLLGCAAVTWLGYERVSASRPALTLAGLFGLLYFLCPSSIMGTWGADRRFMYPAAMLAVLSVRLGVKPRWGRMAAGLAVIVLLARTASLFPPWALLEERIQARIDIFDRIAPGSRVFRLVFEDKSDPYDRPFYHLLGYAVIRRQAVAPLFADPTQQPMSALDEDLRAYGPPPEHLDWAYIFARYQYVWTHRPGRAHSELLRHRCANVAEADDDLLVNSCR